MIFFNFARCSTATTYRVIAASSSEVSQGSATTGGGRPKIVWHVEQRTCFNLMVTDVTCEKKDMLLVNYEAPNGERRHRRLWNGGNGRGTVSLFHRGKLIDRVKAENIGCEYGEGTLR